MPGHSPGFVREIWDAQGGICALCGKPVGWRDTKTQRMTQASPSVDHVLPKTICRSIGVSAYRLGNVTMTHGRCNSERGAKLPRGCQLIWADIVAVKLGKPKGHQRFRDHVRRLKMPLRLDLAASAAYRRNRKRKEQRRRQKVRLALYGVIEAARRD